MGLVGVGGVVSLRSLQQGQANSPAENPTIIAELPTSTPTPLPLPTHTSTPEPTPTGTLVVPPTDTPTPAPVKPTGLQEASVIESNTAQPPDGGNGADLPAAPTAETAPVDKGIPVSGGVLSPQNSSFLVLSGSAILLLVIFGAMSRQHRFE